MAAASTPHDHVVQFTGPDDSALVRNVGRFLADGLARGDAAIVIANAPRRAAFAAAVRTNGIELEGTEAHARFVALDAAATLARFVIDGQPDESLFRAVIGGALGPLRSGGRHVRAYGEMVGIFWDAGRYAAAARLEELWNRLLTDGGVELFCAYSIDVLGERFRGDEVDALLRTHRCVVPADETLHDAVAQAVRDVLGRELETFDELIAASGRPAWGALPRAEATLLWLRSELPAYAERIVEVVRERCAARRLVADFPR